jgi:hypothetical protein
MILLFLSIAGLALGPVLDRFVRRQLPVVAFLEGFVAATILGLVLGHILPEAVEIGGWLCLPAALLGLVGPQLAERWGAGSDLPIHGTVAVFAVAAIFLHTLMDGAALAAAHHAPQEQAASALAIGVVLHRLPVGLTLWWLVRRGVGTTAAVGALAGICLGTVAGFSAGEAVVHRLDTASVALFQALVGGSLIHVVLHRSLTEEQGSLDAGELGRIWGLSWSGVGALLGIAALLAVPLSGHRMEEHVGVVDTFLSILVLCAPYLLAGLLAVGLLHVLAPTSTVASRLNHVCGLFAGSLTRPEEARSPASAPPAARVLMMGLTPLLGVDVLLLSVPTLSAPLAIARISATGLFALVLYGLFRKPAGSPALSPDGSAETKSDRRGVLYHGLVQTVDRSAPWLLIGFFAATMLGVFLPPNWFANIPTTYQVIGLALLAALIPLPNAAALPVCLALLHRGLSPGAALAFLVVSPVLGRAALLALAQVSGRMAPRRLAFAALLCAVLSGLAVNQIPLPSLSAGALHDAMPPWRLFCAAVLILLFVFSLLRVGPAAMVARLGQSHDHHHHGH